MSRRGRWMEQMRSSKVVTTDYYYRMVREMGEMFCSSQRDSQTRLKTQDRLTSEISQTASTTKTLMWWTPKILRALLVREIEVFKCLKMESRRILREGEEGWLASLSQLEGRDKQDKM
ncbi:hypothetical protein PPACK8108_LOCUS4271 [Phakopsora pachyrhizi]|uniref:Uncharacterized protein n=1 Tax=Phakopsora pachyrhizi TaxID=170000 RepID=A0AAV0APV9_PHAPC|nr:hypothetical protein PPACK8108_LOCUS4271 [Phakopsora pachyrhizi]